MYKGYLKSKGKRTITKFKEIQTYYLIINKHDHLKVLLVY